MKLPGTQFQDHTWPSVRKLLGALTLQVGPTLDWVAAAQLVAAHRHAKEQTKKAAKGEARTQAKALQAQAVSDASALLEDYCSKMQQGFQQLADAKHRTHLALVKPGAAAGGGDGDSPIGKRPRPSAAQMEAMAGAALLVGELRLRPAVFMAFLEAARKAKVNVGGAAPPATWRKLANDMYSDLRNRVDSDGYCVATGREMSPSRMYCYQHVEMYARRVQHLLRQWEANVEQVSAILGREVTTRPIESARVRRLDECRGEWILRWSATLARFDRDRKPGPFHTQSNKLDWLNGHPERIDAVLAEIAELEEAAGEDPSGDHWSGSTAGRPLDGDSDEVYLAPWLDAMGRDVVDDEASDVEEAASEAAADNPETAAPEAELGGPSTDEPDDDQVALLEAEADTVESEQESWPDRLDFLDEVTEAETLSPGNEWVDEGAESLDPRTHAMQHCLMPYPLPIRLAVFREVLGPRDDSYPRAWLNAKGELPAMGQLAIQAGLSVPVLRARRAAAIQALTACLKQRLAGRAGCEGAKP